MTLFSFAMAESGKLLLFKFKLSQVFKWIYFIKLAPIVARERARLFVLAAQLAYTRNNHTETVFN